MKKFLMITAILAASASANAAVITFNSAPDAYFIPSYSEAGFTITPIFGSEATLSATTDTSYWNGNGTGRLLTFVNGGNTSGFNLTATNGSNFSLQSFDFGNGYTAGNDSPYQVSVTGYVAGGGTITQTFTHGNLGILTASFGAGWDSLSSVVVEADGSENRTIFDNIEVNGAAPVPEPAMLGLFGMGAIGVGFARRRKAA